MSFTNDNILTLAGAGFTAQQIAALNSVTPIQNPTPSPTPVNNDVLSQILTAIQTNAINASEQPKPQTTDDILADIINPPTK